MLWAKIRVLLAPACLTSMAVGAFWIAICVLGIIKASFSTAIIITKTVLKFPFNSYSTKIGAWITLYLPARNTVFTLTTGEWAFSVWILI